jgi:hypothetical protein
MSPRAAAFGPQGGYAKLFYPTWFPCADGACGSTGKTSSFQTFRGRLFVFRGRVVPVLALAALERDDFSWHSLPF